MVLRRSVIVGACFFCACLGSYFLNPGAIEAAARPRSRASAYKTVVPPPPPAPAHRKPKFKTRPVPTESRENSAHKFRSSNFEFRRRAVADPKADPQPSQAATAYTITTAAYRQPAPAVSVASNGETSAPDPEAVRIQNELRRVRDDAAARRAFYDDLRRTVERVRGAATDGRLRESGSARARSPEPIGRLDADPNTDSGTRTWQPATHPEDIQPVEPVEPEAPQALLSPSSDGIDRAAYLRVLRWAKANGTPVNLALAVAWMESHLNTKAPRGGSGEVGMFQIMPARCVAEGWPARRLNEPEFNAWMGTMLLARYYREEGSVARAAAKYVAGPGVFNKTYSKDLLAYINWYASTVESYANYFSRFQT